MLEKNVDHMQELQEEMMKQIMIIQEENENKMAKQREVYEAKISALTQSYNEKLFELQKAERRIEQAEVSGGACKQFSEIFRDVLQPLYNEVNAFKKIDERLKNYEEQREL